MAENNLSFVYNSKLPYTDSYCTTELKSVQYNYTWTIKDFSNMISNKVEKIETDLTSWRSKLLADLKFVLKIGSKTQQNLQLEIHPSCVTSSDQKLFFKANIAILNIDSGNQYATTTFEELLEYKTILSKEHFISKRSLRKNADCLLPRNSLTIVFELFQSGLKNSLLEGNELSCITVRKRRRIEDQEFVNLRQVEIVYDNPDRIAQDYSTLFDNPVFADAAFLVRGTKFKIHKAIIATRCPVFWAMFHPRNKMKEQRTNTVIITDISPNVFKELLRYIYCGEVKNIEDIVCKLIIAADKYGLDSLKSMCEKTLNDIVNTENVIELLSIAEHLQLTLLRKKAFQFIKNNTADVINQNNLNAVDFITEILQTLIPE